MGFVSYALVLTDAGDATITVCRDKAGTDESIELARDWVLKNASDLGVSQASISQGRVVLHAT